jgi:hypothetical protein
MVCCFGLTLLPGCSKVDFTMAGAFHALAEVCLPGDGGFLLPPRCNWSSLWKLPAEEGNVGDRGKKDKEKGQKQHDVKDKQEDKRKLEKQVKRPV